MTSPGANQIRRLGVLALSWIIVCMNADAGSEKTLVDFHATPSATTSWQVVNDDVMGGVSTSRFEVATNGVAVFSGVLSLENNGGFASVRSAGARTNLAGCEAFVLRARGDGRRYKFTVRTEADWNAPMYQCTFPTQRGKWEEHRLSFQDFVPTFRGRVLGDAPPLDSTRVLSVGFLIADKQEGTFRLEVAWIKASPHGGK